MLVVTLLRIVNANMNLGERIFGIVIVSLSCSVSPRIKGWARESVESKHLYINNIYYYLLIFFLDIRKINYTKKKKMNQNKRKKYKTGHNSGILRRNTAIVLPLH